MDYVCVIGGANVDIGCTPYTALKTKDSNPGKMTLSSGGVSRNIAENLARMNVKVVLITVFGGDANASSLREECEKTGIDVSHSLTVKEARTSTYLCVNDCDGDMFVAVSDMDILQNLTPEFLRTKLDVINGARCVVTDTNIPQCLEFLQNNVTVPVFLDPVSAKKTALVKDRLFNIFCLKPNLYEAQILADIPITDAASAEKAAEKICKTGVKRLYISDGAKGVYYYENGVFGKVNAFEVAVVNTTGAGDSFTAGVVYGYLKGLSVKDSAVLGCAASAVTVCSPCTVSREMSVQNINEIIERSINK